MRVLFATWATRSHYYPLVPLAWALRAAGHEVRIAGQPDAGDMVTGSGLPFVPAGPSLDLGAIIERIRVRPSEDASRQEREHARSDTAVRMFMAGSEAMADDLVAFARSWRPDLVVYEPRGYAAMKAAQVLGVPAVRSLSGGTDYTYVREEIERPTLAPLWERFGLGDPHGALTLDPCPPSLQVDGPLPRHFMRYVPFNGGGAVPAWLREPRTRPRVLVTFGVTFAKHAGNLQPVRLATEAVSGLDVDVVVAAFAEQRAMLGALPESVTLVESMPLHLLLPTVSAVVHQGGAGTMLTSAACGVPQMVLPSIADEPLNARRLQEQGAGRHVHLADADHDVIRAEVAALLDQDSHRDAALKLKEEIEGQVTPADVVGVLESLAG
ncbi:nucleotide disphospho-sugar-binding domain-containing protein [Sphaerisporangium corydalis]|uniref:Nucleotide disphospho-sugar-binding domain-containing protein n=1 Tax=Sphaerisporangium corydalis TaxID=1441875 RepID=A0ABV9EHY6_9ACTN|nr:nucleotide disphospho-sugar-binding domain-containing protein [Sphaerisporangium corydalis]